MEEYKLLNNRIVDSIEEIRPFTKNIIKNYQISATPALYNMKLERRYSFDIHGVYHSAYKQDSLLYVSNDIPFTPNQKRHVYVGTLDQLVASGEVYPLLIFVNGRFIKWSNIVIIKDCKYAYIMICNILVETADIKAILIPRYIRYVENDICVKDKDTLFIFDEDGLCIENPEEDKLYTSITRINTDDFYYEENILIPNEIQNSNLPIEYRLEDSNMILFKNGLLSTTSKIEIHGLNTFTVDYNRFYKFKVICKIFYDTNSNLLSKYNLLHPKNKVIIKNKINENNNIPEYIENLNNSFDFKYDRFIPYEENVYNALQYIMDYDSSLLNNLYKNKSNILSRIYRGKDIIPLLSDKGIFKFSKKIGNTFNNNALIFVNGELWKYYCAMKDKHTYYEIPMIGIKEEDTIEILFFKNTESFEYPIVFDSRGNDQYYIPEYVDIDEAKLFAMHIIDKEFYIESKSDVQFELEYHKKHIKDNIYEIYPDDPYYYNKRLTLVSKRQFKYSYTLIKGKDEQINDVELPDNFRFCNNRKQYIVFVNGRKIDNKNFKITITKKTRPFDDIAIYLNITLYDGDRLEVFYIPEEIDEIEVNPNIPINGKIVIDRSKLSYNFSKDLYIVFVNGKKLLPEEMYDIDSNKVMIIKDIKTLKNLSILKYIKDEDFLTELFQRNIDNLTNILSSIPENDLIKLYKGEEISNDEKDIKFNTIPMEAVMNKLIRDYYLRPYITDGDSFLYDFDDEYIEKDEDGNLIIRAMDANKKFQID